VYLRMMFLLCRGRHNKNYADLPVMPTPARAV